MISGRSDSGVTGPTPFVVGAAKGELEIGPAPYGSKTLAAGRKPGINSINDLKGKKGLTARFGNRCRIREQDPADREVVEKRRSIRQHPLPEPHSSAGLLIDRCLRRSRAFRSVAEVEKLGKVLTDYSPCDLRPIISRCE